MTDEKIIIKDATGDLSRAVQRRLSQRIKIMMQLSTAIESDEKSADESISELIESLTTIDNELEIIKKYFKEKR